MAESTDYVKCPKCKELHWKGKYSCMICGQPAYDIDSATLKKIRAALRRHPETRLQSLDRHYRQAYGQAVEDAVLAKQRAMLKRHGEIMPASNCASGTWHTTGEAIHKAVLSQQRAALAACPGQERRARLPRWNPNTGKYEHKWKEMYVAAMPEGFVPSWEKSAESWKEA